MLEFLVELQSIVRSVLSGGVSSFAKTHDAGSLAALLPMGILFGAAHALTPGHGKTILAAYALGADARPARMIVPALALTVTHVGMAVLLAVVANSLVTRTIVGAGRAPALEFASQILLCAVGIWLMMRAVLGRKHAHGEGVAAGIVAGLIPCPLTLFLMFYALSLGVPEAGYVFALAMIGGLGLVLSSVAVLSALARGWLLSIIASRGGSIGLLVRLIDGLPGALVVVLAVLRPTT